MKWLLLNLNGKIYAESRRAGERQAGISLTKWRKSSREARRCVFIGGHHGMK